MGDEAPARDTKAWSHQHNYGYPALADFIAQDPDHETYVFRKFKRLGTRNILHLQGELIKIEDELDALEREAAKSRDPELHLSMRSWKALYDNSRKPDRDIERKQHDLTEALDAKLKTYCEP